MEENESPKNYFQNWISVIGGIGAAFFFAAFLFLVVLDSFAQEVNPYLGVVYLSGPARFFDRQPFLIPFARSLGGKGEKGY